MSRDVASLLASSVGPTRAFPSIGIEETRGPRRGRESPRDNFLNRFGFIEQEMITPLPQRTLHLLPSRQLQVALDAANTRDLAIAVAVDHLLCNPNALAPFVWR